MSNALFSNKRFQISFISILILLTALHTYYLFTQQIQLSIAMADAFISELILLLLCYILSNVFSYYLPARTKQIYLLAWAAVVALVWFGLCWFILFYYFQSNDAYILFLRNTAPIRIFFGFQIITSVAFYNALWQAQQYDAQILQKDVETKELAKEAELYKLRQQMQPHFLFNSLNSINALINIDAKQARKMINQLSDYLRITLKKEDKEWIPFADELTYLAIYLDIEKVRFGHRLATNFKTSEESKNKKIPALLLQPIVENAIKFGLYDTTEKVEITIESFVNNNYLIVEIHNPYESNTTSTNTGTGFGLKAIARRLHLLYNRTDLLKISKSETVFTTQISLPQ